MSETSSLTELARFIGRSKLNAEDPAVRRRAMNSVASHLKPKPKAQSVTDLLGVVLVLSARTRRLAMPRVSIDIDVFAPRGTRAIRMMLPE